MTDQQGATAAERIEELESRLRVMSDTRDAWKTRFLEQRAKEEVVFSGYERQIKELEKRLAEAPPAKWLPGKTAPNFFSHIPLKLQTGEWRIMTPGIGLFVRTPDGRSYWLPLPKLPEAME